MYVCQYIPYVTIEMTLKTSPTCESFRLEGSIVPYINSMTYFSKKAIGGHNIYIYVLIFNLQWDSNVHEYYILL